MSSQTIDFREVLLDLDSLLKVISDVYGPSLQKVLMEKQTGEVVFTNDGSTIFKSVAIVSHSAARLLVQSCLDHHKQCGNKSKACFMMIYQVVYSIYAYRLENWTHFNFPNQALQTQTFLKSLSWLKNNVICQSDFKTWVAVKMGTFTEFTEGNFYNGNKMACNLIKTFLCGKFSQDAIDILSSLLLTLLWNICKQVVIDFKDAVDYCLVKYENLVYEVPGVLLQQSTVLEGMLISHSFSSQLQNSPMQCHIALVATFDDSLQPSSDVSIALHTFENGSSLLSSVSHVLQQWLKVCAASSVSVIFFQGKATATFQSLCELWNITLIDCLLPETVAFLCCSLNLLPICELSEKLDEKTLTHVELKGCQIGNETVINVKPQNNTTNRQRMYSVIVCSPSPGLCSQYKSGLYNALIMLQHWFTEVKKERNDIDMKVYIGTSVCGGGKFHLALHKTLSNINLLKSIITSFTWTPEITQKYNLAWKLVSDALLVVPKTLHHNSVSVKDKNSRFIQQLQHLSISSECLSRNKADVLFSEDDVIEPMECHFTLICNVINAIIQLCRIGSIVRLQKNRSSHQSTNVDITVVLLQPLRPGNGRISKKAEAAAVQKQYTGFSMVEPGAKSSLELNTDIDDSSNIRNGVDKTVENKEIAPLEGGDFANSRQRPSSPAPYAFHTDGSNSTKSGVAKRQMSPSVPSKSILSPSNANSSCLRAPYAQPVLDASKLQSNKRPATSVDDKISSVRERRQQQQQIIDGHVNARREKEKASRAKWEMEQEIRKKKTEETREKDHVRRKEVEDRKNKQLQEEKKRAEAIVARSDEQIKVVLRQKRSSSVDKSKRWSWGAGGYGGGGGVATQATHVKTAPSPFHYFDATRLTKRVPTHGNEGGDANATPTSTSAIGSSSNSSGQDNRFSKSPLVMNTSHMRFASGLRSYDSSPTQTKSPSPASARGPRARSLDSRQRNRTSSNNTPENKRVATRGRSPAPRAAPNLTSKGRISPQLTEPVQMSSRLLAPTKASAARSRHDKDDNVTSHVTVSTPLRSRNSDRTRPSSAKSDVSSASSARSSPRSQSNKKPTGSKPSPGRSPSPLLLKQQPQPRSPVAASASPRLRTAESPRMKASPSTRSRSTQDAKDPPKRRVSPARLSSPTPKNTPALKKTPVKDTTRPTKSTPPVIKQSLRSTAPPARSKVSSPTTQPPSKTVPVKKVKQTEKSVKKTEPKVKGKTPVKSTPQPKSGGKQKMAEGLNKTFTVSPSLQMSSSNEPKAVEESTTTSPPPINSSQVSTEKKVVVVPDVNTVLDRSTSPDLARSSLESTPVLDEASVVVNAPEEQPRVLEEHNVKSTTQEEVNMVSDAAAPEETHPCTEEDNSEEIPMVMATNSLADEMQMALMSENDQPPKAGEPSGPGDLSLDVNEISTPKEEKTSTPSGETSTPSGDLPLDSSLLHQQEETTSTPSADLPLDSSLLHQQEEQIDEKVIITKEISETVITEAKEEGLEEPHLYNGSVHPEKGGTVKDEITPEKIEKAALTEGPGEKQVASLQEDNTASEITQIIEMIKEDQVEDPSTVDIQPSEQHEPLKNTSPPVPNEIASPEDQKKKEKKLTPEEQAYKDAIAAKRREMKEKREKEEKERLERLKLEAEQQAKREEDARMMAEEARMEQLKLEEEERIKKDELEKRRRVEAEEKERKHEEYMREQRERMEQRAREEAERIRKERDIAAQKKEEERSARRKRLEMIMRRTRGGDSPASNPPSGDQSPANLTPTGGRSPYNSVTPDRVVSPVTVDKRGSAEISALQVPDVNKIQQALIKAKEVPPNDHNTSSGIDTIALELDSSDNAHTNGSRPLPPPFVAFEDKFDGEAGNHPQSGDFIDVSPQNNDLGFGDSLAYETASGLQRENGDSPRSAFVPFKENINEVPTGNLLDL